MASRPILCFNWCILCVTVCCTHCKTGQHFQSWCNNACHRWSSSSQLALSSCSHKQNSFPSGRIWHWSAQQGLEGRMQGQHWIQGQESPYLRLDIGRRRSHYWTTPSCCSLLLGTGRRRLRQENAQGSGRSDLWCRLPESNLDQSTEWYWCWLQSGLYRAMIWWILWSSQQLGTCHKCGCCGRLQDKKSRSIFVLYFCLLYSYEP